MTQDIKKTLHTLPAEVFAAFARTTDPAVRNLYVVALRLKGWTYQSIAVASKLTRERTRQIVVDSKLLTSPLLPEGYPLPDPPRKPEKVVREYVEPDPEKLARLLELQPAAQAVRSNSEKYREEAEEYTKLLADVHLNDKVTLYRLAKRLGVTHGALRFRLVRYKYMAPKNGGASKVYTPILEANRAEHTE